MPKAAGPIQKLGLSPSSDSDLGLISALSIGSHQSLPAFRSGTAKAPVLARPMEDMEAGGFQPGL